MGNTESSLCNLIQLRCVTGGFDVEDYELTSENAAPTLKTFSKALSVDSFISGVYSFNISSSLWSEERSESAYVNAISTLRREIGR